MGITVDVTYKSLNKYSEILCGDTVELLKTEDSDVMILADGMGSGVKANILSTLTAKILGTMFLNGATLEECVIKIPRNTRVVQDKEINEFRFTVKKGDALILLSDGTIHAGVGKSMTFGWPWKDIAEFVVRQREHAISSIRLAAAVCEECDKLYEGKPGDDTTVAVMQIIDRRPVHLMTGPPVDRDDDERIISEFMKDETASRIVSGGTSATILSRELGRPLKVSMDYTDPEIPPIAYMDGIELVTEGVLTLSRVVDILNRFVEKKDLSYDFFKELDKNNGASMLAKILIEDCTELNLYVGKAINSAYQNPGLPFDLGIRQNLVRQLKTAVEKMGKRVTVTYY